VRDPETWARVLREVVEGAGEAGLAARDVVRSPITGSDGNVEFLLALVRAGAAAGDIDARIDAAIRAPA
jgi:23S rRNA (cytidine1920-2'-O)/16S rRNA (cytidine1409-2'-O)-methyltransferase